jgi:hypothetical protein
VAGASRGEGQLVALPAVGGICAISRGRDVDVQCVGEEGLCAIDLDMSGCDVGAALAIGFVVEGLDEGAVGTCCTKSGPFDYDPMVSIAH